MFLLTLSALAAADVTEVTFDPAALPVALYAESGIAWDDARGRNVLTWSDDGGMIARAQARIDRSMDVAIAKEAAEMNRGLSFLATVGSTAPFIGLFGTVLGIKNAFEEIAIQQNTNLAVVAPGIAEALLATALGLLAAIPAVIFYNKLSADSDQIIGGYEAFADEFATILSRQLDS